MKKWTVSNGYLIYKILQGRSNVYLITTDAGNILIDTGKQNSYKKLIRKLQKLEVEKNGLRFLVLTHSHFDHCANAAALKKYYNCKVILGKAEHKLLNSGKTLLPKGTNVFSNFIVYLGARFFLKRFSFSPVEPDLLIQSKYNLNVSGPDITLLPTPGHSEGSISILVNNEIALVGDAAFGIFRNSAFPPFADNVPTLIKSWGNLLYTGCRLFLPGHGFEISRDILQNEYEYYSKKQHY
ncbi:MAG: MBL fold metallo-hydrolase [Bacteroidales bacterium]|nr:MBL fold metallo-hydrolase [Bacteroidales bacterium]